MVHSLRFSQNIWTNVGWLIKVNRYKLSREATLPFTVWSSLKGVPLLGVDPYWKGFFVQESKHVVKGCFPSVELYL